MKRSRVVVVAPAWWRVATRHSRNATKANHRCVPRLPRIHHPTLRRGQMPRWSRPTGQARMLFARDAPRVLSDTRNQPGNACIPTILSNIPSKLPILMSMKTWKWHCVWSRRKRMPPWQDSCRTTRCVVCRSIVWRTMRSSVAVPGRANAS